MNTRANPREISREAMLELPIGRYEGEVCLVATPHDLERARADLLQETIVGYFFAFHSKFFCLTFIYQHSK